MSDVGSPLLPPRQRRAVILADLVESVRLMQQHEASTIERWRRFVAQARERVVPAAGARIVRTAGDALLIEAEHAAAGVQVAFGLHAAIAALNVGEPPERLMQLRIGLHVAEVVVEDGDLLGAGANLAARLGTLGQPCDTIVSADARAELADGVHADLVDLGLRYVKGLEEPVRAFSARAPGATPFRSGIPLPAGGDLRPAIAVVPFHALPADAAVDALGHAMADEVIATLARHPALRVLSRHSTAALRGMTLDLAQLPHATGASFLLTGQYYVHNGRILLTAELCALPAGEVLWSGRASTDVAALFEGSDDLVPHIVSNVASQVVAHELKRTRSLAMNELAPFSLFVGGTGLMNSLVRADFDRARGVFEHLIERHPRQAAPYAMLANWHLMRAMQGWSQDWKADEHACREMSDRALDIDPAQATALSARGAAMVSFAGDAQGARAQYEAAIASDPTETWAWARLAAALSHLGEHEPACNAAERAIALSPLDPNLFVFESFAAMATMGASRYDEAVRYAQASVRRHALHMPSYRMLTAALWLAGRQGEARSAAERYLELQPGASAGIRARQSTGSHPVWRDRFIQALLAAGVPA
jgi:adenylate cyclase